MKKFSKKGVLLFAATMAACAFAMPSMASASSWGTVGTHHTLTSTNLGFTSDALGVQQMCGSASFTASVTSAANLEITGATSANCTWIILPAGATCTGTTVVTNLPWTATAVTTSNIQIHGIVIDTILDDDHSPGSCDVFAGQTIRITGTLSGGRWTGNGAGQHSIEFLGSTGLVAHFPGGLGGTSAITPTGTIGDTSLTVN